jgi:membrane associated rhomboid family serine protease
MNQMQFSAPTLTRVNKIILIGAGVCFLLAAILRSIGAFSLPSFLGLSGAGFFQGLIFQLITYPIVEVHLMSFIFSSLIIWFIGSELESNWGSAVYARFLGITVISVGIIYALTNLIFLFGTRYYSIPLHGLSGITFALLIAYAMIYPHRQLSFMMLFPMSARTFCWILAGIDAYMAIFSQITSAWAHLLAMGISFLIIRFQTHPLLKKLLHLSFSRPGKKKSKKGHLYVVKDDDDTPPKYWQ